jgi:hypothetical protein
MTRSTAKESGWLRNNGLGLVAGGLFLGCLVAQALCGWHVYNQEQLEHGQAAVGLWTYLGSGNFGESVFENWESEFLQIALFVLLTKFLYQKGSSESKDPEQPEDDTDKDPRLESRKPGAPWPVRKGGLILAVYERSLFLAMALLFVASFLLHAYGGVNNYNEEQLEHGGTTITFFQYVATSQFWFESFQNWQSEFLAVGALIVFSIYLRERGSPQSKPVAAPHTETG